ncbi:MAG: carboxypeptidase-like regulatory domain-containing protein, partial [Nitrospiria bacterium]
AFTMDRANGLDIDPSKSCLKRGALGSHEKGSFVLDCLRDGSISDRSAFGNGSCRKKYRSPLLLLSIWMVLGTPSPALPFEVVDVFEGGTIRGTVRWTDETVPAAYLHKIEKNRDFCGKTTPDDALLINAENRGMEHVLVYLVDIEKGKEAENRYVNRIKGCRFIPRVMGAAAGSLLGFRHDDFITHNIHLFRLENNATILNFGLPIHRWQQTITRKNRHAGLLRMQCDIHVHMNGLIVSLEHGYFSTTDADGTFEISDVPPGTYQIAALQGGYQIQNIKEKGRKGFRPRYEKPHLIVKAVEVKTGETAAVTFEFDLNH